MSEREPDETRETAEGQGGAEGEAGTEGQGAGAVAERGSEREAERGGPPPLAGTPGGRRFERFTERAKKVLVLAQEEALSFNHNYIGTEHLLLGLLREEEGIAARVLKAMKVEVDETRAAVELIVGRGTQPASGPISLTPRGKRVIQLAEEEARRMGHFHVGTEHLLLGMAVEGEGIAAGVLDRMGATAQRVRIHVLATIATPEARAGEPAPAARNNVLTCRVDDADLAAIDTLLEAGVRTTRSEAASWLIHAGIQANRALFAQVESTVAEIRQLRGRAQTLAQQAMEAPATDTPGTPGTPGS
jgi:ATP-dependent Clp protease ATP-binding subunit ClpA